MRWYHYVAIVVAFILVIGIGSVIQRATIQSVAENAEDLKPIGYLLIMHEDGEEHFEVVSFTKHSPKSSDCTFIGIDGRVIYTNDYTFIYY